MLKEEEQKAIVHVYYPTSEIKIRSSGKRARMQMRARFARVQGHATHADDRRTNTRYVTTCRRVILVLVEYTVTRGRQGKDVPLNSRADDNQEPKLFERRVEQLQLLEECCKEISANGGRPLSTYRKRFVELRDSLKRCYSEEVYPKYRKFQHSRGDIVESDSPAIDFTFLRTGKPPASFRKLCLKACLTWEIH